MPLVQHELRKLARRHMGRERAGHTLQATALVNEVFVRLIDGERVEWRNRAHFFALAARLMRRILVDSARAHRYQKTWWWRAGRCTERGVDRLSRAQSRDRRTRRCARGAGGDRRAKSQVVELRYFGGLSVEETAEALHVSRDTVLRDWRLARGWLLRELTLGTVVALSLAP